MIRQSSLVQDSAALVLLMAAMLFAVPGLWRNLLATGAGGDSFMTHYNCYLQIGPLVGLHFFSDLIIGFSYVAISLTLAYLVNRARRDIPFHWVFLAFGVFSIACGSTHFMEAWTTFRAPVYWLAGYLKLVTAVASVATAIVLPPLVPRTLALVRDAKLSERRRVEVETANRQLEAFYRRAKELEEVKSRALAGEAQGCGGETAGRLGPGLGQRAVEAEPVADVDVEEVQGFDGCGEEPLDERVAALGVRDGSCHSASSCSG